MKMNEKELSYFEEIVDDLKRFLELDPYEVLDYTLDEACDDLLDLLHDTRLQVEDLKRNSHKLKD